MKQQDAKPEQALPHDLILEGRNKLTVTGVRRVIRCDAEGAAMLTSKGTLELTGNFIAGIYDTKYRIAYRLFGSIGNNYLLGCEIEIILIFKFRADSFTQIHITGHRRIKRKVIVDGFLGSGLDMLGGKKVGFTHAQVDNINTLRF